jgi:hypothetical protein
MDVKKFVQNLCAPAQLYFGLHLISIVATFLGFFSVTNAIVALIGTFIWSFILNKICGAGLTPISWFLVLVPIVGVVLGLGITTVLEIMALA